MNKLSSRLAVPAAVVALLAVAAAAMPGGPSHAASRAVWEAGQSTALTSRDAHLWWNRCQNARTESEIIYLQGTPGACGGAGTEGFVELTDTPYGYDAVQICAYRDFVMSGRLNLASAAGGDPPQAEYDDSPGDSRCYTGTSGGPVRDFQAGAGGVALTGWVRPYPG